MATANLIEASANYPKLLVAQTLTFATAPLYTGQANTSTVISSATLCNTSGTDRIAYLTVTKAGGNTVRLGGFPLRGSSEGEPGESCIVEELLNCCLGPGDVLSGYASAGSAIDIVVSGAVSS